MEALLASIGEVSARLERVRRENVRLEGELGS